MSSTYESLTSLAYLVAAVLFIMALRGLSSPESSRRGNFFGMLGMAIAIVTTILSPAVTSYTWIVVALLIGAVIGIVIARKIAMTAMPQLVAAFHSLVGLAAVLVAGAAFSNPEAFGIVNAAGEIYIASRIEMGLGVVIGAITFSGSVIAFTKLQGLVSGKPMVFGGQHLLNALIGAVIIGLIGYFCVEQAPWVFWTMTALAFVIGILLIIPIGGADMPVVVSMLNSYSGWAAAGIGFTLHNDALIVTGALVGSSGAILSYIMCKGMNRSFFNVILGGFGADASAAAASGGEDRPVKRGSAEDAAFIMKNAGSVIIVPGYGMAVAQAQHALREMADELKHAGVKVSYAIHPVAGRMPGHMNVLLAEANVPYDEVFELEDINNEFQTADVAFVIGANDVTNPAAKTNPQSPIFGMPILEVEKARTVLFVKRSMASGYAGVENELFHRDNTMMLFGDAKKMVETIVKNLA
ncbi:NAD(P)(+) transhydrogenase (Re/Si-specific) subunit beta [Cellvibrio japonicus]|uniref:NAD(P) transhydrogenase subunit beta n=1 Tax=Cellvibrio japonicus (strain Ueda107) TaxID=498211 RepID=B3PGC2_CELJU|nr:NAD(P)(+) transhydrogenase (Re/Si-specific) subunit beta [Cellvibrio japonicus]ACE83594.1 proton-translocating nicotinamide nucleotide transhydrogenase subunit PntB [Cellvibrio japonicus Ueda107]QEI10919.1 NAD(P)(+) transhydrogenase (Re/Si-specific) subunit beta [Cellvibrio japonicus]QEI14495.1 NAD(P)(+) transhydrogenase (Re/Si-specific) subunit beta [Cellvibrio japonicus]QEI18073.1 NAD(P)(+) transhydrogenase (Re/Si-specific) subunit beta [Cellvibrio japonicus]